MPTVPDRNRLREEEELAVGPLLARAKLFRMRGQWDEAIAACTDVLRKFPISVTACSLLGEIYEAQGRLEDAIQWYGMALERDPNSNSDRAGMERVTAARQSRQSSEAVLKPATSTTTPGKPVTEKTLEWFDRLFPPGDNQSIARMLYAVSGIIVVLLLISAGIFYLVFQNRARTRPLPEPIPALQTFATPVVVEPTPHPAASTKPATSSPSPAASTTSQASNGEDSQLLAQINQALNNAFVVQSLHRENGNVSLELIVPSGESADKSREIVVHAAIVTVRLVGLADNTLQSASIHASMPTLINPTAPIPVFSGDVKMAAVREIDPAQISYIDLLSRFTRLQWEGPLLPNGESPASPTPSPVMNNGGGGTAGTTTAGT